MADNLKNADWFGMIVSATSCYACQFGEHLGVPHTWGAGDDFAHAWATFQDAPSYCGCSCRRPSRTVPKVSVRPAPGCGPLRLWLWSCPICSSGRVVGREAALTAATKHCSSVKCRYRRFVP